MTRTDEYEDGEIYTAKVRLNKELLHKIIMFVESLNISI